MTPGPVKKYKENPAKLEQISTIRDHLMESNQHTQLSEQRRAIQVSDKLLNPRVKPEGRRADGLIWPPQTLAEAGFPRLLDIVALSLWS